MTVSFSKVGSAGGAAAYFSQDNYYTVADSEAISEWGGEGAKELGLTGQVETAAFEKILNGQLPDGEQIGTPGQRALGTDITFSAPKSVSLAALVTGDKRIEQAQQEAVSQTVQWFEKNFAEARVRIDGTPTPVRTGNLVYAMFSHDTSRALDPQLHTHVVIANLTRLPEQHRNPDRIDKDGNTVKDSGWRAWHNQSIVKQSSLQRLMYHSILREKMEELGYRTEITGKQGIFELKDINQQAIDGFSKRAADINDKAEELGLSSDSARDKITVTTRDAKLNIEDRDQMVADWRKEAKAYGYNGDEVAKQAISRSAQPETALGRAAATTLGVITQAAAAASEYLKRPNDPLVDPRLTRLHLTPAEIRTQFAVASAVRIESEKETTFGKADIARSAMQLGMQGVTIDKIDNRLDELVKSGQLVPEKSTRYDGAVDRVTTHEAIKTEREILTAVDQGVGHGRPLIPMEKAADLLQSLSPRGPLGQDQLAAALTIISSNDRIIAIQGRAGSGKSTMLQPVAKAEALEATGHALASLGKSATLLTTDQKGNAQALAFQNKMVSDLAKDTGMNASTLHAFLAKHERFLNGDTSSPAFHQAKAALQGRYLLLDEASMVSNSQMRALVRLANMMEVGRLAIIGDHKQLSAMDAGKPFAMILAKLNEAQKTFANVLTNRRQQTPDMQALANAADKGDLNQAFKALGDNIKESTDPTMAAAKDWLALRPEAKDSSVLLPSGRAGRELANNTIQAGLKQQGVLTGKPNPMIVRENADPNREQMRYAIFWKEASHLEVLNGNNPLSLPRGYYQIERINTKGQVTLTDANGKNHRVNPTKIPPDRSNTGLRLMNEKKINIHKGETLRWTDNDKQRGIANQTIIKVQDITKDGISLKLADGTTKTFDHNDPMLKYVDLAYAINTHMAQGITVDKVMAVMGSKETNLSNMRSFLVNFTRQKHEATLYTDNADKLKAQIASNRGDKTSAVEAIGELNVTKHLDLDRAGTRQTHSPSKPSGTPQKDPDGANRSDLDRNHVPKPPVLDRSKGMEL